MAPPGRARPGETCRRGGPRASPSRDGSLLVVVEAEVRDELLARDVAQRVLELRELDEEVVLRVEPLPDHRALEVEGEPLLDPGQAGALREVEEERDVERDRRGED